MKFAEDSLTKKFTGFFIFTILCMFISGIFLQFFQIEASKNMIAKHSETVADYLLSKGVSEDVTAAALLNTTVTEDRTAFLNKAGFDSEGIFFSSVLEFQIQPAAFLFAGIIIISLLFAGGIYTFTIKREKIYYESEHIINEFTKGNSTCMLDAEHEGTLFRFLNTVNKLIGILHSKKDRERNKKEFLKNTISDISHQLKTPLSALYMYNEIILDEPDNSSVVIEYSKKSETALKKMTQLIQSMLKITRLDAGNIIFKKEWLNAEKFIKKSISELMTRAELENKKIILEGNSSDKILCDLEWTGEAVLNIVKNALDHTHENDEIKISWTNTKVGFRLYIADTGEGISEEDIHHIFKRFYRTKNSLDLNGVGLGLSLAKNIIEGQNGLITVNSLLGQGTTFIIVLDNF